MPRFSIFRRSLHELTSQQEYIRKLAHEAREWFCSVCRLHPPKYVGGPCDHCDDELGAGG